VRGGRPHAARLRPRDRPQADAVVVGHSLGGQTIAHVAAKTRVYLGAIVPVENPFADAFAEGFGGFVRDEAGRSYWPDADTAAARMYPDCSRMQSDWAFAHLRRQAPIHAMTAPFGKRDIVIATMRDAAVDAGRQIATARKHGARVVELDAGHSPFLTQPDELADVLNELA